MAAIRAGELDRRVVLLQATETANGLNEKQKTWGPAGGMPPNGIAARRTPISDGERGRADQILATATDRFLIRWAQAWSNVGPTWELECEGVRYGIVGVKEVGRREGLELTCVRRADG